MKKMQQAAPEFTTDADGLELAHVALANTEQRATLHADDFRQLMAAGWSKHWALTNTGGRFEYVLAYARGPLNNPRTVPVARLIAQAPKGRRVTYIDGDRTNLRRDNLRIVKGGGLTKAHASTLRPSKDAPPQRSPAVTSETLQTPRTTPENRHHPLKYLAKISAGVSIHRAARASPRARVNDRAPCGVT
jgi:hypothetical protein